MFLEGDPECTLIKPAESTLLGTIDGSILEPVACSKISERDKSAGLLCGECCGVMPNDAAHETNAFEKQSHLKRNVRRDG